MNTTVVILAAGLGTRMRSKQAKVLHRAGGLALVEHAVAAARAITTPDRIVVVTGHQAEAVEAVLAPTGVSFVRQTEQKGTGHAIACCREKVSQLDGQLMILYGDVPLLSGETVRKLRDLQASSGAASTLITTEVANPQGYGRIVLNQAGDIVAIVEQKAANEEQKKIRIINSGICTFDAPLLWKYIVEIKPNPASGEYYLTDMAEILVRHGHRMIPLHVPDPNELLGINTRVELAEADRIMRDRKNRALMLSGVTIEQPESVTIDVNVEVGQDTVIEPHVRLLGTTKVGADCSIGAGSILDSALIDDDVKILPYSLISDSHVSSKAEIGPFSRLRAKVEIGPGAQIGNFAELKNSKVGEGSKSHHVSYLGDATLGANVNIGAGTITANYDGRLKHRTNIGNRSFIGTNSTLVAPAEIGDEAYVAAGSVITEKVESEALALGRARQVVKPGWVKKPRDKQS